MTIFAEAGRDFRRLGRMERFQIRTRLAWRRAHASWRIYSQNRLAMVGLAILFLFAVMAIAYPVLMQTIWPAGIYDPETGFDLNLLHPTAPGKGHLLGTDSLGRDVLSMLMAATAPTFTLGITVAITTAVVGMLVGGIAAYRGGFTDQVLMHIADAFLLLPAPIVMIIIGVALRDTSPVQLGIIYGIIAGLGANAVVLRTQARSVMHRPFVAAARAAGGSGSHILSKHLFPHLLPYAATLMMLTVTGAVVADAFISFFGLTRLYLNWGTLIYLSQTYSSALGTGIEWHTLLPPAIALSLFGASFYMVGRGLRDVADPGGIPR